MDNASNNDGLARLLPLLVPSFRGMAARGRCFPHIINLLAKVRVNKVLMLLTDKFLDFHFVLLSATKEEAEGSS
jgi:hypothetical protein